MPPETVAIAADHAGRDLKEILKAELEAMKLHVIDLGTSNREPVDYPDFADAVAAALHDGRADRGVLVCGTGIGIGIAANRHRHVRAAVCHDATSARLARQHTDANVLAVGARLIGADVAKECVRVFFTTGFEGGRHLRRLAKLA